MSGVCALDSHQEGASHSADANDVFGFWVYILSDCVLFASLFATFVVFHDFTCMASVLKKIIDLPYALVETVLLLGSSFTYGMAMLGVYRQCKVMTLGFLVITFLLGASFVGMELREFFHLVADGYGWQKSAQMSSFFTLVGTHGLHVTLGLLWMFLMMLQVLFFGFSAPVKRRLFYLGLFWHFLDIVWIFVFTVVYLMGAI